MKFSYDYAYLNRYIQEHRIVKKELLDCLGSSDYVTINKWLDGKVPIHLSAMIRFCNHYEVPIDNFFCDEDSPCTSPMPSSFFSADDNTVLQGEGYSYDKKYLLKFMHEHRLKKKDLLEALGATDYVSINKWLEGKAPIHVCALLRLCNYYEIPLDGFFRFNGEKTDISPVNRADAQRLPTDNYGIKAGRGRGIVLTLIEERTATSHNQQATIEQCRTAKDAYYNRQRIGDSKASTEYTTDMPKSIADVRQAYEQQIQKLKEAHKAREEEIRRECQTAWQQERRTLLEIIDRQNALLTNYSKQSINT